MTDFTRPTQSDFIRELQRLHENHMAALRSQNPEAIDHAEHELLRYNHAGRLPEYWARQTGESK